MNPPHPEGRKKHLTAMKVSALSLLAPSLLILVQAINLAGTRSNVTTIRVVGG